MFLPISLIFTLLRIVIPQVSQKICPQFICVNPQNITLNGQVCFNSMVINDNSLISVSKCETNSYCNYSSLKNYSLNRFSRNDCTMFSFRSLKNTKQK